MNLQFNIHNLHFICVRKVFSPLEIEFNIIILWCLKDYCIPRENNLEGHTLSEKPWWDCVMSFLLSFLISLCLYLLYNEKN